MNLYKIQTELVIGVLFLLFLILIGCSNELTAIPSNYVEPTVIDTPKMDDTVPAKNTDAESFSVQHKIKETSIECRECQYVQNGKCIDYECCSDNQCAQDEICVDNTCVLLDCEYCWKTLNHKCFKLSCCEDSDCDDGNLDTKDTCIQAETWDAHCTSEIITQSSTQTTIPVQSVRQVVPFTGKTYPCDDPNSKFAECNYNSHSESLELSLVPNHEDSAIFVQLNMDKLENFDDYHALGFWVYKENEQLFQPSGEGFRIGNDVKAPLQKKRYKTSVSNLNPNSEYEICLIGMFKDLSGTGLFNCKTIHTHNQKQKHAIVFVNYDVSSQTQTLVDEWINEVEKTGISIEKQNLNQETNGNDVYSLLRTKYAESNLLYAVFIGQDLPMPMITLQNEWYNYKEPIPFSFPLRSLTFDTTNQDSGFLGPTNPLNEITIAVIKYDDKTKLNNYFQRVINHYKSPKTYSGKILLADAMIPAESSINNYNFQNMDYFGGITDYNNIQQANTWQTQYKQKLKENHDILVINAHGSQETHYPCGQACVHAEFIRENPTKIPFIIAVSCNIGYFMQDSSPMLSYIFGGESLAGIGSEVVSVDVNGILAKRMIGQMLAGKNIGDTSRTMGFTVIGDPFLKLNQ